MGGVPPETAVTSVEVVDETHPGLFVGWGVGMKLCWVGSQPEVGAESELVSCKWQWVWWRLWEGRWTGTGTRYRVAHSTQQPQRHLS